MFVPHLPTRPADIYTIRIAPYESSMRLAMSLRRLVTAAGGTFMISLMEGPGFIFRMPTSAPCPLTSFLHGGLLEEGCIHVSRMRLEKEAEREAEREAEKEAVSDVESVQDDDAADHPGLRIRWGWTELNRDATK